MNFTTPQRVLQTIRAGDDVEFTRGENRLKITNAANNAPPLDPQLAKKLQLKINVNWGELMILLAHARRQYLSAFWSSQNFFNVTLPGAPSETQSEWGAAITEFINNKMRNSLEYFELHRSRWSAVVCHGQGPILWDKRDRWLPVEKAIEDVRIPTDTVLSFRNLGWFGVRNYFTPYELCKDAFGQGADNRWDKKQIAAILRNYKEINFDYAPNHYDWDSTPEKLAELVKQDGGYYASDAMPAIPIWDFYFKDFDKDGNEAMFLRKVPEQGSVKGSPTDPQKFLWEYKEPYAKSWKEIIHLQYGDLNAKSPFLYHSVRSLGFALLEPTFYTNLTRCKMLQHLFDQFNVWLRITDPADKARPNLQEFANFGVLKAGVNVVPSSERHQVDGNLVEMALSQLKQLQQEASASYTQDSDTGTKKEQTAFETSVKMQQVNAMMGGLLMTAFIYAGHEYNEICRRFCLQSSSDADIQDFFQFCKKVKIPRQWVDSRMWRIEPVSPIGMGNPTLAQANAKQLVEMRPLYDSTAQQEILHEATLVITGDARKARRWVPLGTGRGMTDSQRDAMAIFGTLMQGVPVPFREGLSPSEQIETLIPLMAGVITRIEKRDNVGTPDEVAGLQTVGEYIGGLIQMLAQNKEEGQRVKQYGDVLGNLMNQVKALAQRGQEQRQKAAQAQADNGAGGEQRMSMLKGAMEMKMRQAEHQQKQKHESEKFAREQRRDDARTFQDLQRQKAKDRLAIKAQAVKTFQSSRAANGE